MSHNTTRPPRRACAYFWTNSDFLTLMNCAQLHRHPQLCSTNDTYFCKISKISLKKCYYLRKIIIWLYSKPYVKKIKIPNFFFFKLPKKFHLKAVQKVCVIYAHQPVLLRLKKHKCNINCMTHIDTYSVLREYCTYYRLNCLCKYIL